MTMNIYTDEQLKQLMSDLESDLVERKESWTGDVPQKGREAICAFANDLADRQQPGVLFVGVSDNGSPVGLDISDELLRTLADIKTDGKILPPPTIVVQKSYLEGADIAVVIVIPSDAPPVRYKGRIWIRLGSRRGIATAQDERILNEKRRHRDIPFDAQPIESSTINDLSKTIFEQEYLPHAFADDVLRSNERSYEQRLAACKMVDSLSDTVPTVVGMLTLGRQPRDWLPGAYVQFLRIDGTELTDEIVDVMEADGDLSQVIIGLDQELDSHN